MRHVTRWVSAALVLALAAATLPAWRVTAKANLRECQAEALKSFAHGRKANEHGVMWPPYQLEIEYITYCMSARGFVLRNEPAAGGVLSGESAIHVSNPESWSWDFARLLPKSVRDML